MKKVKKMALGGVGGMAGKGMAGMAGIPKVSNTKPVAGKGMAGVVGIPKVSNTKPVAQTQNAAKQMQFMSDMLRGAPMASTRPGTAGPRLGPMASTRPGTAGPRLGDTFKGNPNIQKIDTSTGGPPLQRFSNPEQYKQAEATYKQMQQQQQLANSVGRLPSVTADLGQLAKGATMAVPARGISRGDLRMAGLKKGGAVKSSASKRGDGIAQRGKTKGRMV